MNGKFGLSALIALAVVGCGEPGNGANAGSDAGTPAVDSGTPYTPPPDAGYAEGLPCDVYGVLKDDCDMCHGKPLQNAATVRLISRVDLINQSEVYPDQTVALRVLARMSVHDGTRMPPPPYSEVPITDYTTILSWVNAGMPVGNCDPNALPTVCSSGSSWTFGNAGSPTMNPGLACIDCHRQYPLQAPHLTAAGTVYPSRHEKDLCYGSSSAGGTITVEVIDSDGTPHSTTANSAGNFYFQSTFKFPITARVTKNGRTRVMVTPQATADCNSCHTEQGTDGAPGRIYEP